MIRRLFFLVPTTGVALVLLWLAAAWIVRSHILELVPPGEITFAAGRPGSGYAAVAEQYRLHLAQDGIRVTVLDTAGSMENSRLLASGEADVALIQGGTPVSDAVGLVALAGVFVEPVLVFHRPGDTRATDLAAWQDLVIAAGEPGSGTRVTLNEIALNLGIDLAPDSLLPLSGADAATALLEGEADVAFFVAPIDAPYLAPLLTSDAVEVNSLRNPEALARRFSHVRTADIPVAGLDYARGLPREPIPLVAMVATLAAQGDLHPALVNRMVNAAEDIHAGPSLINPDLEFPSTDGVELPLNTQAAARIEEGPNALENVLPYWAAAQITRISLLLVPLVVLLLPILRALPSLYSWTMRARIYRRYEELLAIERESEDALDDAQKAVLLTRLEEIEREAKTVNVPLSYREHAYDLRVHIELVRQKLQRS